MTRLQPQRRLGIKGLILLASTFISLPAAALEMEFMDGDITLSVSHSLTVGANYGFQKQADNVLYGGNLPASQGGDPPCEEADLTCSHGGTSSDPNIDIGHINYEDTGIWSSQFKGTTDIEATWGDFGAFTRLLYYYDHEVMGNPRTDRPDQFEGKNFDRWKFDKNAKDEIGRDIRTLDAYLSWETYVFDKPLSIKVGDQVINWGQSTFLPGIGLTNPVDLVRLFSPGFELRELFKPVGLATVSFGLSENINLEAYYQYSWAPVNLPPGGSFMAVNNYTGEGVADSGLGSVCLDGTPIVGTPDEGGWCIYADPREDAKDGDEFGFRFTWTVPGLNYTQFDFYAVKYHNRLPTVGANKAGLLPNRRPVCDALAPVADGLGASGLPIGDIADAVQAADDATDPSILSTFLGGVAGVAAPVLANTPLTGLDQVIANGVNVAQILTACQSGQYNIYADGEPPSTEFEKGINVATAAVSYVEDLWAYGFSWAGNLPGGWSFQGEMSLKKDFPIQYALPELISAAMWVDLDGPGGAFDPCAIREIDQGTMISDGMGGMVLAPTCNGIDLGILGTEVGSQGLPHNLKCSGGPGTCDDGTNGAGVTDAWGMGTITDDYTGFAPSGYDLVDVFQAQFTLIKLFPQMFGGDTLTFVFEGIYNKVIDMPTDVQFETPNFDDFTKSTVADDAGWGYRILMMNEYSGLFGTNWNFKPILAWFHDVKGSPPTNLGTFLEGRRQMVLAGVFEWNQYKVITKYAYFGGAKCCNVWQDRDSVSLTFQMGI